MHVLLKSWLLLHPFVEIYQTFYVDTRLKADFPSCTFMFNFFKSRRADVMEHWYALIPGFTTSTKDFYAAVEKELKDREVPGVEIFYVDFAEGGLLSAKREYLRMTRERLVFDICAAPFGKAYFFSCRFAEIPAVIHLWQLLVLLAAFGICLLLSF